MEWNLSHTMMPGIVSMVTMLLAVALTADQLVTEKEEGLLTRDYVCGVGVPVYLAAQVTVREESDPSSTWQNIASEISGGRQEAKKVSQLKKGSAILCSVHIVISDFRATWPPFH